MFTSLVSSLVIALSPISGPSSLIASPTHGGLTEWQSQPLPRRGALGISFSPVTEAMRTQYKLGPNEGLIAGKAIPGLTADKIKLMEGDIILSLNGKAVTAPTIGATVREIPSGSTLDFKVARNGTIMNVKGPLIEKPRDPGNENFEVVYSHIVSNGQRMRTIITRPRKPGKYPGFFFIQGYSPISYDFTLATSKGDVSTIDGPLLFDFANRNFVTMRVEKPGVGDSEGGPFADIDYITELDIYRQALKQLKEQPGIDNDNIFIFGHSMGGAFGPMVASEIPVKGIAVYGVAARTWQEYLVESIRHQNSLAGMPPEAVDEDVRISSRIVSLAFHEGMSAEAIKKAHPKLAPTVDAMFPGGMFNNKTLKFWAQLGEINFPKYWALANTNTLAVKGASDFVVFESCHKLIADSVNAKSPGKGKWLVLPNSDHLFHGFATEKESQQGFTRGTYSGAFSKLMMNWIDEILAK